MKNYKKYFGTDGIRGTVGNIPITPDFILKLGWAAGKVLSKNGNRRILIGKDTRISGCMIESALQAGLFASGMSIISIGIVPTPAISYLTRFFHAEAGIVISASHNPFYDNGIKFFSFDGTKISNREEKKIEKTLFKPLICVNSKKIKKPIRIRNAISQYINFCKQIFPKNIINLTGLKIIVDCANGSTYNVAPNILIDLGAEVININCEPNGININEKCGTTDTKLLKSLVVLKKADLGIAYDGDGDRIIMIDHLGNEINGDQILYIIVRDQLQSKKLFGGVVGTLMSNSRLELKFKQLGIPFIRSKVGDRYVLELLKKKGWNIGAENSGHVILLDKTPTGDGIITGLYVLSIMIKHNIKLHDLCKDIRLLPQKFINIRYNSEIDMSELKIIKKESKKVKKKLGKYGRILLRKSGTESIIRIMVEGEKIKQVNKLANYIANMLRSYFKDRNLKNRIKNNLS